ncbi:MAG: SAM-dependent methyltransferase, partial [Micrococcales bacterium]|nr:SAM-dependent methyltransferase [Micrococcales bacterium]
PNSSSSASNLEELLLVSSNTGSHELTSNNSSRLDAELDELGEYIYEPDSSLIRSQLIGELAQQLNLKIFSPEIAYLTSNENIDSVWLKKYKLLDNLPFDRKRLKAYLNERNIGPLEIKKRGTDVTPEQLRKELNLKGKNPATLIITRVNDNHRVLVVAPR